VRRLVRNTPILCDIRSAMSGAPMPLYDHGQVHLERITFEVGCQRCYSNRPSDRGRAGDLPVEVVADEFRKQSGRSWHGAALDLERS
jgi:hypothetical protein